MPIKPTFGSSAFGALSEDRSLPFIVYGLYILGFPVLTSFITFPLGLIVAYANINSAGPRMRSHYVFQIRTVWTWFAWILLAGLFGVVGLLLSWAIIGLPLIAIAWCIAGSIHFWFGIRCIAGAIYLLRDEAYPRPRAWLF